MTMLYFQARMHSRNDTGHLESFIGEMMLVVHAGLRIVEHEHVTRIQRSITTASKLAAFKFTLTCQLLYDMTICVGTPALRPTNCLTPRAGNECSRQVNEHDRGFHTADLLFFCD
jgi:hypothetical protein